MILAYGSDRGRKELRQRAPKPAQSKRARSRDLVLQHAHLALRSLRSNPQKGLPAQVRPTLGLLYGRNIDVVSACIRREWDRNLEGCQFAGRCLAWQGSPLAFQNEEIRLGIEELPAH